MTIHHLEDVFVTEGVPEHTFVFPPNYTTIKVDIRREGKPVIIEGQSGTGKTTVVKKILTEIFVDRPYQILTPRNPKDVATIDGINEHSGNKIFIIDDFHILDQPIKERLADLAKLIAERDDRTDLPKLVIIGINNVGSDLIQMVPDIAKRFGIHKVQPGSSEQIKSVIELGCKLLNITINKSDRIIEESRGDYWLTQQLCKTICVQEQVDKTVQSHKTITWDKEKTHNAVVEHLRHNYEPPVKIFCKGQRFRPSNDPYFKLLKAISEQDRSFVDLNDLANSLPDIKGSINNIKDHRLTVLLRSKQECSRLFYYDANTKNFSIEDPALFFYLQNLDWDDLRRKCGFRDEAIDYEFDIAISFAGENRTLAEFIVNKLKESDISVFYDRNYENNYLGGTWSNHFMDIFNDRSRLVVALLDKNHKDKIWPTFERDCFKNRISKGQVIPVHLDQTNFPGIPSDIVSIFFDYDGDVIKNADIINQNIVDRILAKMEVV